MERLNGPPLAYIAGFFDSSKGWLNARTGAVGVKGDVEITPALSKFRLWFGGTVTTHHNEAVWTVQGQDARAFLLAIHPYVALRERIDQFLSATFLGPAAETKSEGAIN